MQGASNQLPDDLDLPSELRGELKALYGRGSAIPSDRERAILAPVAAQLAKGRRIRLYVRWGGAVAAIAAVVLVAVRLVPHSPAFHEGQRVTILDAFSLARQLKAGGKPDRSWDVNHDGRVDQADVDVLAGRAVALGTTGGGQ